MPSPLDSSRQRQRGVTILLVVVALVVVLGMAALAIDVVTLYVARTEAQRAADAAALAGAKAFVTSGFTSSLPGFSLSDVCNSVAGSGGPGAANKAAEATAAQNLIAGVPATVLSINCNLAQPENPQIAVTVQRTNLPTFFARIWGSRSNSVSATATAEAYNPSGSSVPVSVAFVKPFLIPNCDPSTAPGATCTAGYFVSTSNGALNNPAAYIGVSRPFPPASQPSQPGQYYIIDPSPPASVCPGSSALPSGSCDTVGGGGVYDNIACANVNQMSCGQTVNVDPNTATVSSHTTTADGARCLIHASASPASAISCTNPNPNNQDCFLPGPPVTINGGTSNPNPAFRPPLATAVNISRSDSVVTVPVYDGLTDLCPLSGSCSGSAQIVGFLQLGIQDVRTDGTVDAIVLNATGCNPSSSGTAVLGGGVSPIPVRLIHN
ncbi:MAG: hypothetical protein LAN83_17905 [Acidobacteriia bacterium]|nr:hypothetical protein [Terriglobia bacterium]